MAPAKGAWVRVPGVPRGNGRQLALGIAVFAPGITPRRARTDVGSQTYDLQSNLTPPGDDNAIEFAVTSNFWQLARR
ncbi:hypothetical protein [Streptomyces sp. NBC_00366]|uniref:hypothetical protein n=1 Tax=unclassified Streptomyces TaxID=2593676 RepID=UPI003FA7EEDF